MDGMAWERRGDGDGGERLSDGDGGERFVGVNGGEPIVDYGGASPGRGDAGASSEADDLNAITGAVVNAAYRIHRKIGPGLMENVYETVLARDLRRLGLSVERQKLISFDFEGMWFEDVCRADLVIEKAVVVEVKSAVAIAPVFEKQLLTYLRLLDCRLGLLINFGAPLIKQGIKRIANGM